jgi:hypothetical protein
MLYQPFIFTIISWYGNESTPVLWNIITNSNHILMRFRSFEIEQSPIFSFGRSVKIRWVHLFICLIP